MLKSLRTWSASNAHLSLTFKTHTALNVPIWNISLTLNCFLQHTICLRYNFPPFNMLGCGKIEPLQFVSLETACPVFHTIHWNSGLQHLSGEPLSIPTLQLNSTLSLQHNLANLQQCKKWDLKYQESINNNSKQFKVNIPEMSLAHQVPLTQV